MAQLKEGSVIKKSTGDEIIATINDLAGKETITGSQDKANQAEQNAKDYTDQEISSIGGGVIVDLGIFNDTTELMTHVVMNQLPTGHYTFMMEDWPWFMLLRQWPTYYEGTFYAADANFFYFNVSIYGEIREVKVIRLREVMTDFSL